MKNIIIKTQKEIRLVPIDEILYITQMKRKLKVVTLNNEYYEYKKIKEVKPQLDERFYDALKYTIVNLSMISGFKERSIVFKNGNVFLLGRDCYNRTKKVFLEYISCEEK